MIWDGSYGFILFTPKTVGSKMVLLCAVLKRITQHVDDTFLDCTKQGNTVILPSREQRSVYKAWIQVVGSIEFLETWTKLRGYLFVRYDFLVKRD